MSEPETRQRGQRYWLALVIALVIGLVVGGIGTYIVGGRLNRMNLAGDMAKPKVSLMGPGPNLREEPVPLIGAGTSDVSLGDSFWVSADEFGGNLTYDHVHLTYLGWTMRGGMSPYFIFKFQTSGLTGDDGARIHTDGGGDFLVKDWSINVKPK